MPSATTRSRILSWPDRYVWRTFVVSAAWLTIEWIIVYGGANWIAGLHSYRVSLETRLEWQIPFVPAAAVVYLSLFPLLWLAPFRLRSPKQLHRFATALGLLIVLSGIGFLILPGEQARSAPNISEWNNAVFHFADQINLTHNYLPSLHVGLAVLCALAYRCRASPAFTATLWVWTFGIVLSTLVTHQHFLIDIVTGSTLAAIVAYSCDL